MTPTALFDDNQQRTAWQQGVPQKAQGVDEIDETCAEINAFLGKHRDAPRPGKGLTAATATAAAAPAAAIKQQGEGEGDDDSSAEPTASGKAASDFRNYIGAADRVKTFYATQHARQTVAYNLEVRQKYLGTAVTCPSFPTSSTTTTTGGTSKRPVHARLTLWQAMELLDTLCDESDPDAQELTQVQHLLQAGEAARKAGAPEWMQVVAVLHDVGKVMALWGAEQWEVVGDTFVVGAGFDERNIYPDTFSHNPDSLNPLYSTPLGVYPPNCGLSNVLLSWGHDEYLYSILSAQTNLPPCALDVIRYHSFYPWHREGAYRQFHDKEGRDDEALRNVLAFNPFDLYSKADEPPNVEELRPYYEGLFDKFLPGGRDQVIEW